MSPLRAQAKRIKGTSVSGSPVSTQVAGSGRSGAGTSGSADVAGAMGQTCSPICTVTATRVLSTKNEKGLMCGEGVGRPPPGPVVPGDQDVPAGEISLANISSACFCG